ncbi:MAG TPA: hypothetical protein VGG33_00650 [Polyangia bacterium]
MSNEAPPVAPPADPAPGAASASAPPNDGSQPVEPPPPPPPEVLPALAAFEAGDFAAAARLTTELLARAPSPDVATAATALRSRLQPDPWAVWTGVAVLAVLALVSSAYLF